MEQITRQEHETKLAFHLNKGLGLKYYECPNCHIIVSHYFFCYKCDLNPIKQCSTIIYRDCGCEGSYWCGTNFRMLTIKKFKAPNNLTKNWDFIAYAREHNITQWSYLKVGGKTKLSFNITGQLTITDDSSTFDCSHFGLKTVPSYQICISNPKLKVNNIPCKLFYTEYTESSYQRYFVTYIIALDYDEFDNHIQRYKLLRSMCRNRKSLMSRLPKDIITIIRNYLIRIFRLSYQWNILWKYIMKIYYGTDISNLDTNFDYTFIVDILKYIICYYIFMKLKCWR